MLKRERERERERERYDKEHERKKKKSLPSQVVLSVRRMEFAAGALHSERKLFALFSCRSPVVSPACWFIVIVESGDS